MAGTPPLELWGGIECSFVRVRGQHRDQFAQSGHWARLDDLDRVAELGIRTLRYPVLWDHHAGAEIDWSQADARLKRLRELGIRPIVGLIHHGCGPLPDGMLDPGFVDGLATFARKVAERYPWVEAYTPVNEPATTARFSGLYGHWHPHGADVSTFGRCFLNECLATRAAMRAIREVNPGAQLVQTEDVGKVHSTSTLAYQAAYENERRWLTFDVLCGRVDRHHVVHAHLLDCGVPSDALASFVADPCPPDVLGMNYYVTSERFLDERLERYPPRYHGGNGRQRYADVDAVRVRAEGLVGPGWLLQELWQRYRRPIAITEVQLACTREEQVRWLVDTWHEAHAARAAGVDIRAITAWSLFGAYDWNSLLVHAHGHYENGAFDVRGPRPRPTAVAAAISDLIRTGQHRHPVLATPGWWRRPVRLEYEPVPAPATGPGNACHAEPRPRGAPIVVLGAGGTLGQAFLRLCELRGLPAIGFRRQHLNIAHERAVRRVLTELRPWAVINCAGTPDPDRAESTPERCRDAHVVGTSLVAAACAASGSRLLTFSCADVFDGTARQPYDESAPVAPLSTYGRLLLEGERTLASLHPAALLVRTGPLFGPWDERNFVVGMLQAAARGEAVRVAADHVVSPTYVPDLVHAALDLLVDGEAGIWHLANAGHATEADWGRTVADLAGVTPEIQLCAPAELGWTAPRPRFAALASVRGRPLPPWADAVERCLAAMPNWSAAAAA